ncbi:MAG: UxaA family hydrolase [Pseudomonadota bacterium]
MRKTEKTDRIANGQDQSRVADAIQLDPSDQTTTLSRDANEGQTVAVQIANDSQYELKLLADVPQYFKIALVRISNGSTIRKYRQSIGVATTNIETGARIHIHNLRSCRDIAKLLASYDTIRRVTWASHPQ